MVDILGLAAPELFSHIEFSTLLTKILVLFSQKKKKKILVLFNFRTVIILLTLCAHTHLEVNFNFSIGIRAWYTLLRFIS